MRRETPRVAVAALLLLVVVSAAAPLAPGTTVADARSLAAEIPIDLPADSLTFTDDVVVRRQLPGVLASDGLSATDAFASRRTLPGPTFTDALTAADTIGTTRRLPGPSFRDDVTLVDQFGRRAQIVLAEALGVGDAVGRGFQVALQEAFGLGDVMGKRFSVTLAEAMGVADATGRFLRAALSEAFGIAEAMGRRFQVPLSEAVALGDQAAQTLRQAIRRAFSEAVTVADQATTDLRALVRRAFSEAVTIADQATGDLRATIRRSFTQSVQVADAATHDVLRLIQRTLSETVAVADEATSTLRAAIRRTLNEAVTVADQAATQLRATIRRTLTETVAVKDTVLSSVSHVIVAVRMLIIGAFSPVDILVTDPLGRRVGFDPASGQTFVEIGEAFYSGPGNEPQLVILEELASGGYQVQAFGRGTGSYTIRFESRAADTTIASLVTFTGEATPGSSETMKLVIAIGTGQVSSARQTKIDVRPGDAENRVNLKSGGDVTVAILSEPGFEPRTHLDRTSLTFGRTGNESSLRGCPGDRRTEKERGTEPDDERTEDVNGDGVPDLVCRFRIELLGLVPGDAEAVLKGRTRAGEEIMSIDRVRLEGVQDEEEKKEEKDEDKKDQAAASIGGAPGGGQLVVLVAPVQPTVSWQIYALGLAALLAIFGLRRPRSLRQLAA